MQKSKEEIEKREKAVKSYEAFGSVDMWANARQDFRAGYDEGYKAASEELDSLKAEIALCVDLIKDIEPSVLPENHRIRRLQILRATK